MGDAVIGLANQGPAALLALALVMIVQVLKTVTDRYLARRSGGTMAHPECLITTPAGREALRDALSSSNVELVRELRGLREDVRDRDRTTRECLERMPDKVSTKLRADLRESTQVVLSRTGTGD